MSTREPERPRPAFDPEEPGHTHGDGALPANTITFLALASYLPMAAIGIAWIGWAGGTDAIGRRLLGGEGVSVTRELTIGLATGLGVLLASHLVRLLWRGVHRFEGSIARTLGPIRPGSVILLAATSALGEEILFRAAMQPALGLLLTTTIFAILHFPYERELRLWPLFAFLVGLLLGWLYERTDCVIAPTAAHFLVNAVHLDRIRRRAARHNALGFAGSTPRST